MNQARIGRVAARMREMGLSQILVTATASVYYLTGYWVEPHERMIALYLDDQGKAVLYGNEIFGLPSTAELPLITHKDGEDPVAGLAKAVRPGRLGVDKFWYSKFLIGLMEHRSDVTPVLGSEAVDLCRKCKDEDERKAMRHSSAMNDQVVAAAIGAIRAGVRENELAALVNKEFLARGADCEGTQLVCFGANGADPHHSGDGTVLKPGDSIIFDIFTPISRYWCDMTRTVFYQRVSDKQREVHDPPRRTPLRPGQMRPGHHHRRGLRALLYPPAGPRLRPGVPRAPRCGLRFPYAAGAGHGLFHRAGHLPARGVRRTH